MLIPPLLGKRLSGHASIQFSNARAQLATQYAVPRAGNNLNGTEESSALSRPPDRRLVLPGKITVQSRACAVRRTRGQRPLLTVIFARQQHARMPDPDLYTLRKLGAGWPDKPPHR
jgi:hypothetical protein